MQALILAGGEGTRLRPLTSTIPKPVIALAGRPFISYMLDWLHGHGFDDVVMSCGFLAAQVRSALGDGADYGVRLRYVEEPSPLGTAGALKLAERLLDERFLMLNGDVLTDMDLGAQLAQHDATRARATLALVGVADPSAYGLVRLAENRAVVEFVEKPDPAQIDTNLINAGAYVLERDVLDLIEPDANVSIERDVFPRLVGDGLFGYPAGGYWLDIGTPERYLEATADILLGNVDARPGERIAAGATIAAHASVDELSVLGAGASVGEGAAVERSVVLDGADVGPRCVLRSCIVGPSARVGAGTSVETGAVLGEGAVVGAGTVVGAGARIVPGVTLPAGAANP